MLWKMIEENALHAWEKLKKRERERNWTKNKTHKKTAIFPLLFSGSLELWSNSCSRRLYVSARWICMYAGDKAQIVSSIYSYYIHTELNRVNWIVWSILDKSCHVRSWSLFCPHQHISTPRTCTQISTPVASRYNCSNFIKLPRRERMNC